MLYYKLNGYEDFKQRFGLESRGTGAPVRKNKILLGHLKSPLLLSYCVKQNDYSLLHVDDIADLQKKIVEAVRKSGTEDAALPHEVELIGEVYRSAKYRTDDSKGVCEDLDKGSVRYVNVERERVFKMKSGKFMRELILETRIGKLFSPSVLNWLSGDVFTQQWCTYTYGHTPEVAELHVDDDFRRIYSSSECRGDFGSCMTDRNREGFYQNAVKAKAAYITDKQGYVLARAVLFTDVTDQDGKKWRLLERQYSSGGNDVLKRLLVDKLLQGGHIDGYKIIGASCHETNAFVAADGSSLSTRKFEIDCELGEEETLSYQDSFKWYRYAQNKAYNYPHAKYTYELDTTDLNLYGDQDEDDDDDDSEWDEYHQYHCTETTLCHLHGREVEVDSGNLDDFIYIGLLNEYHHEDDCTRCDECQKFVLDNDAKHSDITGQYYCCETCMKKAEDEFKRKNWYYSEYDDKWYEDLTDITHIHVWNAEQNDYEEKSISTATLCGLLRDEEAWEFDNESFNKVNPATNLPYGYKLKKKTRHEYATVEAAV